jgi:hypothetical protein
MSSYEMDNFYEEIFEFDDPLYEDVVDAHEPYMTYDQEMDMFEDEQNDSIFYDDDDESIDEYVY